MKNVKPATYDIGGQINAAKVSIKAQILGRRTDWTTTQFASKLLGTLRPVFNIHIVYLTNEYYDT